MKTAMKKTGKASKKNSKAAKTIPPDRAIKLKFAQEQSHSNFVSPRREMTKSPHRMSKSEKSERKK